jgi:hypothetical protein
MKRKKDDGDLLYSERGGGGGASIAMVESRGGGGDGVFKGELPQNRSSNAVSGTGDSEQPYGFIPKRDSNKK